MSIKLYSKNSSYLEYWSDILKYSKRNNTFDLNSVNTYDILIIDFLIYDDISSLIDSITKSKSKDAKIIILHNKPSFEIARKLLKYGISGYGNVLMHSTHILSAIKMANENHVWLYPEFISQLVKVVYNDLETLDEKLDILTSREKDVAKLVVQGFTNKKIAENLDISISTVKIHISKIFEKFNVSERLSLSILLK